MGNTIILTQGDLKRVGGSVNENMMSHGFQLAKTKIAADSFFHLECHHCGL